MTFHINFNYKTIVYQSLKKKKQILYFKVFIERSVIT